MAVQSTDIQVDERGGSIDETYTTDLILKEIDSLIHDYLTASDPKTDKNKHDLTVSRFRSFLEELTQSRVLYSEALMNRVVMATFKMRGYLIENELHSGILSVEWSEFESLESSWSADLLIELLDVKNFSSGVGVAYEEVGVVNSSVGWSPIELAVKLGMSDILELLLRNGDRLSSSTFSSSSSTLSSSTLSSSSSSTSSSSSSTLSSSSHYTHSLLHLAAINQDIATLKYIIKVITSNFASSSEQQQQQQQQQQQHLCQLLTTTKQRFGRSPLDIANFQCSGGYGCRVFQYLSKLARGVCGEDYNLQGFPYGRELVCPSTSQDSAYTQDNTERKRWLNCIHNKRSCKFDVLSGYWRLYGDHKVGRMDAHCDLPRIQVGDITPLEFERDFVNLSTPVVITGLTRNWSLSQALRRDVLLEQWADMDMLVGEIPYGEVFGGLFGYATVSEFIRYMDGYAPYASLDIDPAHFEAPLYVFDGELLRNNFKGKYSLKGIIPPAWRSILDYPQFVLGPAGSGAPFHFHCHALNVVVYGRKKWFLYPPSNGRFSKQHPLLWYKTEYSNMMDIKPLECVQMPGDLVYVPSRWAHATINIDECVGVAIEYDTGDC